MLWFVELKTCELPARGLCALIGKALTLDKVTSETTIYFWHSIVGHPFLNAVGHGSKL